MLPDSSRSDKSEQGEKAPTTSEFTCHTLIVLMEKSGQPSSLAQIAENGSKP
jgi:hypothetical protein